MLRVAVTGGIGAGKSAVARLLATHGAVVVDADQLAREALAPGSPGEAEVLAQFGPAVAAPDGSVDRAALAAVVFADADARRRLERIVHPRVERRMVGLQTQAAEAGADVFVYDVPLLAEAGRDRGFDVVVVVEAPLETRLQRLEARGTARADALARMAHQADDAARRELADVVVVNDGTEADLAAQVDALWAELGGRVPGPA